jgi:hypothetical protein
LIDDRVQVLARRANSPLRQDIHIDCPWYASIDHQERDALLTSLPLNVWMSATNRAGAELTLIGTQAARYLSLPHHWLDIRNIITALAAS